MTLLTTSSYTFHDWKFHKLLLLEIKTVLWWFELSDLQKYWVKLSSIFKLYFPQSKHHIFTAITRQHYNSTRLIMITALNINENQ